MKAEYEELAQEVLEAARRVARNASLSIERYQVTQVSPLHLDGVDNDQVLAEDDDDVEIFGDPTSLEVGDVLVVIREDDSYIVQVLGGGGGGGPPVTGDKTYVHTQNTGATVWTVASPRFFR